MDDFSKTVGEMGLSKLYADTIKLMSEGAESQNVVSLYYKLKTMEAVIEPLLNENFEYITLKAQISKDYSEASKLENNDKKSYPSERVFFPKKYAILREWFKLMNGIIDKNQLLFSTSKVFGEATYKLNETDGDK